MSDPARKIVPAPNKVNLPSREKRGLIDALAGGGFARDAGKFIDFMPDVEAISQRRHSPFATVLVVFCCLFVAAAVGWMILFNVEQVVTAGGVARPASKVKLINHPDGGRVVDIPVKDGDRVNAGDVLLRLDPEQVKQEIGKLEAAWYNVGAEVVRLQAEANGTKPEFDQTFAARPDIVAGELRLYEARQLELVTHRNQADAAIAQIKVKIESLTARIASSTKSLAVLQKQAAGLRELSEKGYYSTLQYQTTVRKVLDEESTLNTTKGDLVQAQKELAGALERRSAVDSEWRAQLLKRLGDAIAERDRAEGALRQQNALLQNLVVRSPIAGIVQGLRFNTVGQALRGGEQVMNIVPIDDNLLIEVKVSNDDIGYVRVGQPAAVKIQTYDWARYGSLKGVVEQISADATTDEKSGVPYFTVWIRTEANHLTRDGVQYPVLPGMTGVADLHIGERSIMSYFMDRLTRTMGSALKER
jgi:HlyD family type I secretion membrane fusion protein